MKTTLLCVLALSLAGSARAAKLVRCEARLELGVGSVAVPGWGMDEETARMRAREQAWLLAWADRWPGLAAGVVAVPSETTRRDAALRKRLDPATDWEVPGAVVREGECISESLPPAKGVAWEARWEREDRKVVRNDASVAVEAARRRQCWGAWSHRMVKAATLAKEASEERHGAMFPPARAATDGLFRCVSRGSYDLVAAKGPLAGVEDPGPVECRRPRRIDGRWLAVPGWGPTLESARESALVADLGNQLRRAEQALFQIAELPDAAQRSAAVEGAGLATLAGNVVATDLAEQALMSCITAAPKTVRPAWTPPEGLACGGWPVESWPPTGPADLEVARDRTCAGAFRTGATGGSWGNTLRCDASCRADLQSDGWNGRLVWRPIEPSRASVEDAETLLSAALADKDFHLLGIATGGLIFEPTYAAAFKANPTAFWGSIEQARASGSWEQLAYWEQVHGAWVLAFRER